MIPHQSCIPQLGTWDTTYTILSSTVLISLWNLLCSLLLEVPRCHGMFRLNTRSIQLIIICVYFFSWFFIGFSKELFGGWIFGADVERIINGLGDACGSWQEPAGQVCGSSGGGGSINSGLGEVQGAYRRWLPTSRVGRGALIKLFTLELGTG